MDAGCPIQKESTRVLNAHCKKVFDAYSMEKHYLCPYLQSLGIAILITRTPADQPINAEDRENREEQILSLSPTLPCQGNKGAGAESAVTMNDHKDRRN